MNLEPLDTAAIERLKTYFEQPATANSGDAHEQARTALDYLRAREIGVRHAGDIISQPLRSGV